jgi:hypothetical protein
MNKKTETIRRTDSIEGQVASLSRLGQAGVRKIKFGQQLIELDLREKILKLGLDLHYRQVTVGMQEGYRAVQAHKNDNNLRTAYFLPPLQQLQPGCAGVFHSGNIHLVVQSSLVC